jgi:hypothetical protein
MADPAVRGSTQSVTLTPHPQVAFYPGEKFEFDIKYEFIHAGEASLEVTRSIFVASRPTLGFLSIARSNGFVDNFFKVRDFNGSQVDEASLASVNFHQNLREGHYRVLRTTSINYELGKYFFEKVRKGNTTKQEGPITQPVSDILSSFFYTRTLPLEPGKEYSFPVFSDQEIYQMKVVVGPKLEKIRVEAGEFLCLRVTPQVIGDAIFQASDGKMTIWMTNDERKMPVLIRSKVAVGAFDAELTKYRPGVSDQP